MWWKSEESKVMALIEEHLKKVEESLKGMMSTIEDYLKGQMDSAESYTSKTRQAESEADELRRTISDLLHRGAFLPIFREDVMQLVGMVDRIAECAQDCSKFITIQRPDVPDDLREDFLKVARDSVAIMSPLDEGVNNLSEDFSITREKVAQIHRMESDVDELEWQLSRRIFSTDLELACKMHLRQLVDMIVAISDIAEDAAEILETLVVKKQV